MILSCCQAFMCSWHVTRDTWHLPKCCATVTADTHALFVLFQFFLPYLCIIAVVAITIVVVVAVDVVIKLQLHHTSAMRTTCHVWVSSKVSMQENSLIFQERLQICELLHSGLIDKIGTVVFGTSDESFRGDRRFGIEQDLRKKVCVVVLLLLAVLRSSALSLLSLSSPPSFLASLLSMSPFFLPLLVALFPISLPLPLLLPSSLLSSLLSPSPYLHDIMNVSCPTLHTVQMLTC